MHTLLVEIVINETHHLKGLMAGQQPGCKLAGISPADLAVLSFYVEKEAAGARRRSMDRAT